MASDPVTDAVRDDRQTELSRLGSSKALYALTEGEMEADVVRARAGDLFGHAQDRFDDWGVDAAGPADLYAEAAAVAGDLRESAVGDLADYETGTQPAVDAALSDFEDDDERLGAFLGWALVAGETLGQLTGYFTGQADPQTAQLFRDAREEVAELREQAADAVADRETTETAREAADAVVEIAYDDYFETLEALGVNPKPVC